MSYLHLVCLLFFHLWKSSPVRSEPIPLALGSELREKLHPATTSSNDASRLLSLAAALSPAEKTQGGLGKAPLRTTRMKRRPQNGFHADTFSGGFGDFETMKRARIPAGLAQTIHAALKRRPMEAFGGLDTFSNGFGDFNTMKRAYGHYYDDMDKPKRVPEMTKSGFDESDLFNSGFGNFNTMKK